MITYAINIRPVWETKYCTVSVQCSQSPLEREDDWKVEAMSPSPFPLDILLFDEPVCQVSVLYDILLGTYVKMLVLYDKPFVKFVSVEYVI